MENRPMPIHLEVAAGGLIFAGDAQQPLICVVRRAQHKDWTLPKGRPRAGESLEDTARREATEESGSQVEVGAFLGVYTYSKEGMPKVVLIWRMAKASADASAQGDSDEISEVRWVTVKEALTLLSHNSERDFVRLHTTNPSVTTKDSQRQRKSEISRLKAAISTLQTRHFTYLARIQTAPCPWWVAPVANALQVAERGLAKGNTDITWAAAHDAERLLVFAMSDAELKAKAISLAAETKGKVNGWRADAVKKLFEVLDSKSNQGDMGIEERAEFQQILVECLEILHGHSDNQYHRMHLVSEQLGHLVNACALLLIVVFETSVLYGGATPFSIDHLLPISVAGAFGGVVSAMYQLSRVGQAKIPDALLHGIVTSGRPLIGASAALFLYTVLKSEMIPLVESARITEEVGYVVAFVAGFSEQYVLTTVAKVTGPEKETPAR